MPTHTVQAGEHLSGIAAQYGFANADTIWNDAKNANLKKQRPDPNVLAAGDEVFIPQKIPKQESVSSGDSYTFKVKRPKLKLRVALQDFLGKPIVGKDVKLEVDGDSTEGTDDKGVIELEVAATATKATVSYVGGVFELEIGHLDPVEVDSGVRDRLGNLGYLALPEADESDTDSNEASDPNGDAGDSATKSSDADSESAGAGDSGSSDSGSNDSGSNDSGSSDSGSSDSGSSDQPKETAEQEALRLALQDFQVDNDLDLTGKLDDATRSKLREVHGC